MSGTAVVIWNQSALEGVRRTRLGPPMVARAIHVLQACALRGGRRRAAGVGPAQRPEPGGSVSASVTC